MNNPVIECQGVGKSYIDADKDVSVLHDINMSINAGESLSIVGSSGSGKSTLLHLLGGLDTPSTGKVIIDGKDIHRLSPKQQGEWRNINLGFIYQFHHLLPEFSALENVAMPLLIRGESKKSAFKDAERIIGMVGLSERLTHKPSQLSGGERQRIAISRALVTRPACILADEPTGNLDPSNADKVYQLMLDLNSELGTSLIVVTHDMSLARKSQQMCQLVQGTIEPFVTE